MFLIAAIYVYFLLNEHTSNWILNISRCLLISQNRELMQVWLPICSVRLGEAMDRRRTSRKAFSGAMLPLMNVGVIRCAPDISRSISSLWLPRNTHSSPVRAWDLSLTEALSSNLVYYVRYRIVWHRYISRLYSIASMCASVLPIRDYELCWNTLVWTQAIIFNPGGKLPQILWWLEIN